MGTMEEVDVDLRCSAFERCWVDLSPRESCEPLDLTETSDTTLRMLRKMALGATEAKTSQIDGRLIAITDIPISSV